MKIVVGVDGSEGARQALSWAADLARPLSAEMIVVHAIQDQPFPYYTLEAGMMLLPEVSQDVISSWREHQQRLLDTEWTAPLQGTDVRFRTILVEGNAAEAIINAAHEQSADLIVVGGQVTIKVGPPSAQTLDVVGRAEPAVQRGSTTAATRR
jgi:nucleotide-binding universal stress UspA family protein